MPTIFLVELFSGTGSFSSAAEEEASKNGYTFKKISVDIHPKYNPSTCIDIRGWNYKQAVRDFLQEGLGPSDVLWVHASPLAMSTRGQRPAIQETWNSQIRWCSKR